MTVITVLYPASDEATFDHVYYAANHIPMVQRLWGPMGMTGARVLRGVPSPDGKGPPFLMMTDLTFPNIDSFTAAVKTHGAEVFDDVSNFTNVQAQIQVSEG